MDYIVLGLLFGGAGVLAVAYYALVPTPNVLRARLPNKVSWAGILLTGIVAAAVWYIFRHTTGFSRVNDIAILLINLLIVVTIFFLSIRWIRSNSLAILLSVLVVGILAWFEFHDLSLNLVNLAVILAILGPATLLIRLQYLRTKFFMVVAALWTIYDVMSVLIINPRIFRPAATPRVSLLLPAVTAGNITLGSGDFMFLSLFTLIIFRDFGYRQALKLVALEVLGLLITGIIKTNPQTDFPFLVVMTPIFFLCYWLATKKRAAVTPFIS